MYYLNSRYYNADWGRFINADGSLGIQGELISHNLFAYCKNNSINMSDLSGRNGAWALDWIIYGAEEVAGAGLAALALPFAIGLLIGEILFPMDSYTAGDETIDYSDNSQPIPDTPQPAIDYDRAKSEGVPTGDHTVVPHKPGAKNPNKANPNSSSDLLKPDGSLKQRRYYGENGKPDFDIDFSHDGQETHEFPHSHNWDWSLPKKPRLDWEPWTPKQS